MSKGTWDKPDFKPDPEVDKAAIELRARLETEGHMTEWSIRDYPVRPGYDRDSIQAYCVKDPRWQEVRLSMKGKATHEKLAILRNWWISELGNKTVVPGIKTEKQWRVEIQVGNYLGALVRGGQLDKQKRIRRYL